MEEFEIKVIDVYSGEISAKSEEDAIRKVQERKDLILADVDSDITFEDTLYRTGIDARRTIF